MTESFKGLAIPAGEIPAKRAKFKGESMKGWFGRQFFERQHSGLDIILIGTCVRIADYNIYYAVLFFIASIAISNYLSDRREASINMKLEGDSET